MRGIERRRARDLGSIYGGVERRRAVTSDCSFCC